MSKPTKHRDNWRIRWFDAEGNRRSAVYPSFKEAQAALIECRAKSQELKKAGRSEDRPGMPFSELCEYYLKNHTPEKRRQRDDQSIIRVHLLPFFGGVALNKVVSHVPAYKAAKAHLSKKTLHNQLTLLISILRVAHDIGWLHKLPKIKKPRIRLFDKDFSYLRTDEEISRFLVAARDEGELVYTLYATAIYTGMREGELAGLHRGDLDLGRRLICVQRSYDGPTKGGEARYVPILDPLFPILKEWLLKCGGTIVFPNEAGRMHGESARIFQEVLYRVIDRAGFPRVIRNGKERRYIVFHSLRHTFASHWMMNGGDLFKLQKILGHKDPQMTMRYAHLAPDAFAGDLARLGTVAAGGHAQVIPLTISKP